MAKILIIDDQPYLQELFTQEFMDDGYNVVCVRDVESAKVHLNASKPDLVLLDLYLDGFEGWDLLSEIKNKDLDVPVIIVTAYDSYLDDPRVSQADGYVIKGFDAIGRLKEKIREVYIRGQ